MRPPTMPMHSNRMLMRPLTMPMHSDTMLMCPFTMPMHWDALKTLHFYVKSLSRTILDLRLT